MRILALVLAMVTGLGAAAHAGPDAAAARQARKLHDQGSRHHQAGEYDRAIDKFKAGYELTSDPTFLFNIAVSYRKKGDCAEAARYYRDYLRLAKEVPDRPEVERRADEMERCAAAAKAAATEEPRPATPEGAPTDEPPETPPARAVDVDTGPSPDGTRRGRSRLVPILVGGAGVVMLGAGAALAITARMKYSDLEDSCAPDCDPSRWDGYDTRATWGNVLLISGAVAVAAGGYLWWRWRPGDEPASSAAIAPVPGGAVVSASGSF